MGRVFVILILLSTILCICPHYAVASSLLNCTLTGPPQQAGVTETDGQFFFVFPLEIDRSYDGCQTMWDESGKVRFMLSFKKWEIVKYVQSSPEDGQTPVNCLYKKRNLLKTSSTECPAYDSVKNGFRTIEKQHEPVIPVNRDPRR